MRIYHPSTLTVPLPDNLEVKLRISEAFHTFGSTGCELLFLNPSLLPELIMEASSVNAGDTMKIIKSIRSGDQSILGDVAYIGSNGDSIRTLNPLSEIAAIRALSSEYLPALTNADALRIFMPYYRGQYSLELPFGWSVVTNIK